MTALRIIPLPIHSALEVLAGLALGAAPFALGLSPTAAIVGVVAGALIVGLAVQALDSGVGDPTPVGVHLAADQGVALGLGIAALVMAVAAESTAAALFAAAAVVQLSLILVTRYSAR